MLCPLLGNLDAKEFGTDITSALILTPSFITPIFWCLTSTSHKVIHRIAEVQYNQSPACGILDLKQTICCKLSSMLTFQEFDPFSKWNLANCISYCESKFSFFSSRVFFQVAYEDLEYIVLGSNGYLYLIGYRHTRRLYCITFGEGERVIFCCVEFLPFFAATMPFSQMSQRKCKLPWEKKKPPMRGETLLLRRWAFSEEKGVEINSWCITNLH